ncbi:MAG TPA: hypothetical protein PK109_00465 [Candidatus Paceibacterota bacterium]|nr:hypothetical protein [Candidatus Paceibacterota bacterium]
MTGAPSDVRPSQHVEVELNNCRSDVQEYWRVTVAEAIARVNESEATQ